MLKKVQSTWYHFQPTLFIAGQYSTYLQESLWTSNENIKDLIIVFDTEEWKLN